MKTAALGRLSPADAAAPRLLYFADVPIENFMHGSALMYRLLEAYPPEKLLIVESMARSKPERRLPGVAYRTVSRPIHRLLGSRLHHLVIGPYVAGGGDGERALARAVGDFDPEAVLSVVHGAQWQTADDYARRRGLPLHLILHDRWRDAVGVTGRFADRLQIAFNRAYRDAESRFCVSPRMAEVYEAESGAPSEVLYPARRLGFEPPTTVSPRVESPGSPFTAAYAGSIPDGALVAGLETARAALEALGGQLLVFGPADQASLAARGLAGANLIVGGSVHPHELAECLRNEADVLLASVSFDERIREAMEMCFPSKLTDYTAAGLPIIVHGPASCSAARWAKDNPGVAEVVESQDRQSLETALRRLMSDRDYRRALAHTALSVGRRQFDAETARQTLFSALTR